MKQYIGTKIITAVAMNLGEYNKKRGWILPKDEDPNREGYFVQYPDNYVSWSPKEIFEEAYSRTDNMNFGLAVEALKKGLLVMREGWNGKKMFVFKQVPASIGIDIIPKMQSVPQSAKNIMIDRSRSLNYRNQCVIVNADGDVDNWAPSISDCFATDWKIYSE